MSRISIRYARPEFETHVGRLLESLHIVPKNPELYILACVHRSVLNEAADGYAAVSYTHLDVYKRQV